MTYRVFHYDSIEQIPKEVDSYLNQHPVINFEAMGMIEQLREDPNSFSGTLECFTAFDNSEIQVVTCRIIPHNLLISHSSNKDAILSIVKQYIQTETNIPGIYGPYEEVETFTKLWSNQKKESFQTSDEFFQYFLTKLKKDFSFIGDISVAKIEQAAFLSRWAAESVREIIPESTDKFVESCTHSFMNLLEQGKIFIMEVEEQIVSMAGISSRTKSMQAINDVYTPREHRGKGYATELCLFLSDYILNDCKNIPVLWVKATNFTAIKIYENIGFEKTAKMILSLKQT